MANLTHAPQHREQAATLLLSRDMSATLRTNAIRGRRKRQEKRRKLRGRLAHATAAERPALEAKLLKTYPLPTAEPHGKAQSTGRPGGA